MTQRAARPELVLAIVCVGVVLATVDLFIVNIAFPALERDFAGTPLSTLSWVLNAYAIVFAALLVPAGRLADRFSRKGAFLLGVGIFTGASALCAAANSIELLVAARTLQAAGAALLIPSSLGLLLAAYPPERRAGAVRIWAATSGLAAAIGPVLGGLLVAADWRLIFLVNVPVGIAAIVVGFRRLPAVAPAGGPMPDLAGAALLAGAIGAISLALVKGPEWGWDSLSTLGALAGSVATLVGLAVRSGRHPSPVIDRALLRIRPFAVSSLAMVLFSAAFAAMLLSVIVWSQVGWGWSALHTAFAFAPGPLMVPPLAIAVGRWGGRVHPATISAAGCAALGAGVLWWALAIGLEAHYVTAMLPGALLTGIGVGLTLPTLTATATTALPPERFATGSAVVHAARQVGYALGVAVLVAVLGTPRGAQAQLDAYQAGWVAIAVIAAIAAVACLGLRVRSSARVPEPARVVA